ncbi:hypothetical protein TSOC_009285 [Tetrabaena socialis]|uniref:Uncharacterized protein n=1 Tax=Tetrabaena socialis TaxID=47790 RepID=A0A2J7ZWA1_9CHLO|nr:hypothetical protein TSOC_009285 [Tetrabaena socialis]|eukprot:PNH04553.1 hypothetical protein TSOC_009285 [Tetrabaena socialis]
MSSQVDFVAGTLARYGPAGPQVALLAGAAQDGIPTRALVLVGGLTDGLLFAPYAALLSEEVTRHMPGWLVAHASLQSSWQGYGTGSLDRDADDLHLLSRFLKRRFGVAGWVLMGHSTGCQDAARFMQRFPPGGSPQEDGADGGAEPELLGTILQAPVSDHEWLLGYPELAPLAERARELVSEARGDEVVGRLHVADNAPITAARFLSLYDLGGDDDMFSEGLSEGVRQDLLAPVGARPCLLLVSGADECCPKMSEISDRAAALQRAIGASASIHVVAGAPHNLAGHEVEAMAVLRSFLAGLPSP